MLRDAAIAAFGIIKPLTLVRICLTGRFFYVLLTDVLRFVWMATVALRRRTWVRSGRWRSGSGCARCCCSFADRFALRRTIEGNLPVGSQGCIGAVLDVIFFIEEGIAALLLRVGVILRIAAVLVRGLLGTIGQREVGAWGCFRLRPGTLFLLGKRGDVLTGDRFLGRSVYLRVGAAHRRRIVSCRCEEMTEARRQATVLPSEHAEAHDCSSTNHQQIDGEDGSAMGANFFGHDTSESGS